MVVGPKIDTFESVPTTDSLTMGQLKKIIADERAKQKEPPKITYEHRDTQEIRAEIEDWHAYVEEPHLSVIYEYFRTATPYLWTEMSLGQRNMLLESAFAALPSRNMNQRAKSSAILSYIAQGCYAEAKEVQHQLRMIIENSEYICKAPYMDLLVECLKDSLYLLRSESPEYEMEDIQDSIRNLATVIFFTLEASRTTNASRSEEVSQIMRCLDTPIIPLLIEILSQLSESTEKGMPCRSPRQVVLLLRECILSVLGGQDELQRCKIHRRRLLRLPENPDKLAIITTPLDYANFRAEIISKYPSYTPPVPETDYIPGSTVEIRSRRDQHLDFPILVDGQWTATPAPSPPPSPKGKKSLYTTDQTVPFPLPLHDSMASTIPSSIEEAAALFESRQRISVSLLELWQEQESFVRSERGWTPREQHVGMESVADDPDEQRLEMVERLYKESLPHLQDCVSILLTQIWSISSHNLPAAGLQADADPKIEESVANTRGWLFSEKPASATESSTTNSKSTSQIEDCREMEITLKGICGSLLLLLKWFKVSHVLKYEHLAQLLIDADWVHTFHQAMMSLNPVVNVHVDHEDSRRSYFSACASLRIDPRYDSSPDGSDVNEDFVPLEGSTRADKTRKSGNIEGANTPSDTPTNWKILYNTINLLAITQKLVKKKTHRNFLLVQAKTWLHLRRPLRINHDLTQLYCLKLYKGQVPLCSRKWRTSNMKIITQVYMSCRPELREDWMAGNDVGADLEEAKHQEAAIRALVLFYNSRHYPHEMAEMGFIPEVNSEDDDDDDFFENEVARLE